MSLDVRSWGLLRALFHTQTNLEQQNTNIALDFNACQYPVLSLNRAELPSPPLPQPLHTLFSSRVAGPFSNDELNVGVL